MKTYVQLGDGEPFEVEASDAEDYTLGIMSAISGLSKAAIRGEEEITADEMARLIVVSELLRELQIYSCDAPKRGEPLLRLVE